MNLGVVDLAAAFGAITTHWDPHIAGELNGQHVKCVKLQGEFVWHKHDDEDELFLVHRDTLEMRLRDRVVAITGQFFIVPRGVEHQPRFFADQRRIIWPSRRRGGRARRIYSRSVENTCLPSDPRRIHLRSRGQPTRSR